MQVIKEQNLADNQAFVMESTPSEFELLRKMLECHGVEARLITAGGGTDGTVTFQIRNPYKDHIERSHESNSVGFVKGVIEREIKLGCWCR